MLNFSDLFLYPMFIKSAHTTNTKRITINTKTIYFIPIEIYTLLQEQNLFSVE